MDDRKKIESFEDLRVWQKGIQLVKQIYIITNEGKLSRDFGLKDQLRRASVSIPTNIAEGFERASRKEYLNFLNITKGSAGEVCSLLRVALDVGCILLITSAAALNAIALVLLKQIGYPVPQSLSHRTNCL
jgi:four helix bundle protein